MSSTLSKPLPWDKVEKAILKEQKWLKDNLIPSPYKKDDFYGPDYCENCIFRRIAILIVSGKIKAKNIKSKICLWGNKKSKTIKPHGKQWHQKMMNLIANHFKSSGFEITVEPHLNKGRADLGIYKKGKRNLFIEIGSVSLPKLLVNFESMEDSIFLIVLSEKHALEFVIERADYKHRTM